MTDLSGMTDRPTPERDPMPGRRSIPLRLAVVAGCLAIVAVGAVLYGMAGSRSKANAFTNTCPIAKVLTAKADPFVHGEVAALTLADHDNPLRDIGFQGPDGAHTDIAAFKGKTVLLNLWATWCVPCRQEMPALARLQSALGSPDFQVVAVNIDTARLDKPRAFLQQIGATSLPFYADNTANILQDLKRSEKIIGLPTTILIGKDGCEIGTMAGPAQWDSPDAQALIKALAG